MKNRKPIHLQRGAALIVSLLILAVMTILGVTAMSQSGLETLMAGNLQLQTTAMVNSENALNQAEQQVDDIVTDANVFDFDTNNDGFYRFDSDNPNNNPNPITQIQSASGFQTVGGGTPPERYIVEYLGPRSIPGESIVIGREEIGNREVHLFRNTALSFNDDNGARRLVQSIYVTAEAP